MMGLDNETASFWKYHAVLWHWNDRHATDEDEAVEAPDQDWFEHRMMVLRQKGVIH